MPILIGSLALSVTAIVLAVWVSPSHGLVAALRGVRLGPWSLVGIAVTSLVGLPALLSRDTACPPEQWPIELNAVALLLLAALALASGYKTARAPIRGWLSHLSVSWTGRYRGTPATASVLSLVGVGLLADVMRVATGVFGYYANPSELLATSSSLTNVLTLLSGFGLLGCFLAAWISARDPSRNRWLLLCAVLALEMVIGGLALGRETMLLPAVFAFFGLAGAARPRALVIFAVAVGILFAVATPVVAGIREGIKASGLRDAPSGRHLPSEAEALFGALNRSQWNLATMATELPLAVSGRLNRISDIAQILRATPDDVDYLPPHELVVAVLASLVPRTLWADKPILDSGLVMTRTYYKLPEWVYSSSAMTPTGDLWRHGGLWVVLIGMLTLGVVLSSLDEAGSSPSGPGRLFMPLLLLPSVTKGEIDFVGLLASMPGIFISALLAWRLVCLFATTGIRRRFNRRLLNTPKGVAPCT